jgi:hypothetical protein
MIPLSPQNYSEDSGPDLGMADAAGAAWELAKTDTFVGNWARNTALDEMQKSGAKILTPDELNKKYTDVEVPFKETTNELVAFHLNEEAKQKKFLQDTIAKGAGDYGGTVSTAAGIVAHMADPVEFGAGAMFSMGVGALGAIAARSAHAGVAAAGRFAAGSSFAKEAVEGVVGNLALEPYMYDSAQRAQQDYTVSDAVMNVVAGGLAFPGLMFGAKKAWGGLKYASDSIYGTAIKNSIGQFTEGYRPQLDHFKASYDKFVFGTAKDANVGPVRANYAFSPASVDAVKARPMYAASRHAGTLEGGSKVLGDYHGDGVYLTDNPTFANNLAAHPMESELPAGDVFQTRLDKANMLDTQIESKQILSALPDDVKTMIGEVSTVKEAFDKINEEIDMGNADDTLMRDFQKGLQDQGFDGFKYTDEVNGHNGAYVFPEAAQKLTHEGYYKSDSATIQALDNTEMRSTQERLRADENKLEFDSQAKKEWDQFQLPEEAATTDMNRIQAESQDFVSTLDSMAKQELLSGDTVKEIQAIKEQKTMWQKTLDAINDFGNCLIGAAE